MGPSCSENPQSDSVVQFEETPPNIPLNILRDAESSSDDIIQIEEEMVELHASTLEETVSQGGPKHQIDQNYEHDLVKKLKQKNV